MFLRVREVLVEFEKILYRYKFIYYFLFIFYGIDVLNFIYEFYFL